MIMLDAPYITFGSLTKKTDSSGSISAKVWRRAAIAKELGLTEDQLVELAILVGNDFSAPFKRSLYTDVGGDLDESYYASVTDNIVERSLHFILQKNVNYKLTSNNQELQEIIDFSRAFYNLTDISIYPTDPDVHDGDDGDNYNYIGINRAEKSTIRIFCEAYIKYGEIGVDVIDDEMSLKNYVDNGDDADGTNVNDMQDEGKRETIVSYLALQYLWNSQSNVQSNSKSYLTRERMVALRMMGKELYKKFLFTQNRRNYFTDSRNIGLNTIEEINGVSNGGRNSFDITSCLKIRSGQQRWDDVLATNEYQLVCKEIVRALRCEEEEGDAPSSKFILKSFEVQ